MMGQDESDVREGTTSIRVNVSLLDSLMNLAGELVLSRNQLLQAIGSEGLKNAEAVGQRIDLITSELQEAIMQTRMQPIGNLFEKIPRIVRDLASKHRKKVELSVNGKDVELDKTIIESITVPLTSLVQHVFVLGVETPEERSKAGKDEIAVLSLSAFHEAGQVVIELYNDGRGLDGDKLAQEAVRRNILTTDQAQSMSEKDKLELFFQLDSGGSDEKGERAAANRPSVKSDIDKLGGQLEIQSEAGRGTTIAIKLPLTLAIIPCQIIIAERERYAIPQVNLEELLRIPAHLIKKRIETVGNAQVVRLRGKLLPLVRLADVLGIKRTYFDKEEEHYKKDRRSRIADRRSKTLALEPQAGAEHVATEQEDTSSVVNRTGEDRRKAPESALNIVVVSAGAMTYGLIVDRLEDSEEIVIKPLGRHLQGCRGYAGATIMGDGRIALILDVSNLGSMAELTPVEADVIALQNQNRDSQSADRETRSVLLFRCSEEESFAIPLEKVDRIEKIQRNDIEYLGSRKVMQYRNGSLTLLSIDDIASVKPLSDKEDLLVIVFQVGAKLVGLLACGPVDTREVAMDFDNVTLRQTGIAGSTVIEGRTTLHVDIEEMTQQLV